uniref:Uncharacterized protein n=1 Tax=Anguilla anguilla TaxID=7936 RepID=A0A0E9Q8V0_ANGAN
MSSCPFSPSCHISII